MASPGRSIALFSQSPLVFWVFRWRLPVIAFTSPAMKPMFGMFSSLVVFIIVIGGGVLIWYLSNTAEFSRSSGLPAAEPSGLPARP